MREHSRSTHGSASQQKKAPKTKMEYLTFKDAAIRFRRSISTIRNYVRLGILVIHDKDPSDMVTYRLLRQHAETRLSLYQYLQTPQLKVRRPQAASLLARVCGRTDQKLSRHFKHRHATNRVVSQLRRELDSILNVRRNR